MESVERRTDEGAHLDLLLLISSWWGSAGRHVLVPKEYLLSSQILLRVLPILSL